jgi:hypothetical protein
MVPAVPVNPNAHALFGRARSELAWLLEDGYAETRAELDGAGFTLEYRSDHGSALIGVALFKSEFVVFLGSPSASWLSQDKVDLLDVLRTLGVSAPDVYPPNLASREQLLEFLMGYLDGLKALRQDEIAGDWARYDRAKETA